MKRADVTIGGVYYANVSGKKAKVRIDTEARAGGWTATNLETNKSVRIKSAQRLLGAARGGKGLPQTTTEGNLTVVEVEPVAVITIMPAADDKVHTKSKVTIGAPKKLSALSAAYKVLVELNEPMNVQQMVEAMSAKGYWTSPGGKTPHATLYSAILREIKAKGDGGRFRKSDRGRFALQSN